MVYMKRFKFVSTIALIFYVCALTACTPESSKMPIPESSKKTATPVEIKAKALCEQFNVTIDRNIKEMALSSVEGDSSDQSAMQQSARLTQNSNRLSTIMINLDLMAKNKCSPRQNPIDASIYSSQASSCYRAILGQTLASYGADEEKKKSASVTANFACDFNTWNTSVSK